MIINPNSSDEMTLAIENTALQYVNNEYEVICKKLENAPAFIGSDADQAIIGNELLQVVKENEDKVDGFIIACHLDPNLDAVKEITSKPVTGIGEASMKMATIIGRTFSVIGANENTIILKKRLIRKYGLENSLASVRAPKGDVAQMSQEERLISAAELAVNEDKAEVIVLGCAGFSGLDKKIEEKLKVPVLDGVVCALMIISGLVKYENMKR